MKRVELTVVIAVEVFEGIKASDLCILLGTIKLVRIGTPGLLGEPNKVLGYETVNAIELDSTITPALNTAYE